MFLNWVLMLKCVKRMQVRKRGGGEEVHHITWVNSCKEAGFSRVGMFRNLRTGQIHAEG